MIDDFLKAFCSLAPHAFEACVPPPSIFTWITSDGGQLFVSTLLGAVVGASVAGVIQFLISRAEFRRNMRQSAAERRRVRRLEVADQRRKNKTIALHIGVKAMALTNQMYSLMGLIISAVDDANAAGVTEGAIAVKMVSMSGISRDPLEFTTEELAFLFWSNESDLANKLLLLNEKISSLTDAVHTYSDRRMAFPEVAATGAEALTKIREKELCDLADGICQGLHEDFIFMLEIMEELPTAFDRTFSESAFFNAEIPEAGKTRLATFTEILKAHDIEILS
ncbi:hypothetical protein [Allorhizobium taibaishanense]|uniref:Uncharacterized protein n=1 Tax=Allorhizobium taibaishanense TaxID=887144 RepID=A0A1Q9AC03_9HYPH|nr:hypothetical protein [Allorhizobium taibaishanense]MBB4010265.1 hypothetical protein [Allorhizobium taibaishanense]OLP52378.1 hypothetical protein BJF91_02290 [Allorhizobium taibaishanense]